MDSYLVISVGSNISLHAAYAFKWSLLFAQGKVFESEFYKDALKISCMSSYSDTCMTFREKYVLKKSTKTKFFTHLWRTWHICTVFLSILQKTSPFFSKFSFYIFHLRNPAQKYLILLLKSTIVEDATKYLYIASSYTGNCQVKTRNTHFQLWGFEQQYIEAEQQDIQV